MIIVTLFIIANKPCRFGLAPFKRIVGNNCPFFEGNELCGRWIDRVIVYLGKCST